MLLVKRAIERNSWNGIELLFKLATCDSVTFGLNVLALALREASTWPRLTDA